LKTPKHIASLIDVNNKEIELCETEYCVILMYVCLKFGNWIQVISCHQLLLVNSKVEWYLGMGTREVKQLHHDVKHSLPFSAKLKNEWNYTPTDL
jgi:hypothetical protein